MITNARKAVLRISNLRGAGMLILAAVVVLLCCTATVEGSVSNVYGVNFSPYLNGQDPNLGSQISASQITARLQIIAPYTKWIRTFSSTHGLENIPAIARQFGLKVAANAWISKDTVQNALEIDNLIANANAGLVDIAIVGSEAILRNDVTEAQLLAYMNQVRQAIPANIPVTTADVWGTFIAHPNLVSASDIVFANFYPYWEGTSIENAVCSLAQEYQELVAASGSRPVAVSETGWPSGGNAVGAAVPSVANANMYALQYLTWAGANNIQSFYFEAFDEAWKVASEGPQGAHWGIWDTTGLIKPGMDAFFNGQTASVNCNGTIPGPTAIQFTYVPPYGSGDLLEVQVTGVQPAAYVLATYIKVAGGWWTKPTFAQPTVVLNPDGSARIPIVTGGYDQLATDIAVFMIPVGTVPPEVRGGALPTVPGAITSLQVSRTLRSISGAITDAQNIPIKAAVISDPVLGSTKSAPDGKYSFYNIIVTGTATLTVSHSHYSFPQSPITVSIPTGNLTQNFTGVPASIITDLGVYRNGLWFVDWNGNRGWDSADTAHVSAFGLIGDKPVVGDWNGDGRVKIGVYRNGAWFVDWNGNNQWDATDAAHVFFFGLPGDIPVMGDWNGDGRLKAGVYRNGAWFVDWNGNNQWDATDAAHVFFFGLPGDIPVMGDWNGDGRLKAGVYRNGAWFVDWDGNNQWDATDAAHVFFFGLPGDIPVMGDWNGDGRLKAGVYRNGAWFVDWDGNNQWDAMDAAHVFFFGLPGDIPILGSWDPTRQTTTTMATQVTRSDGNSPGYLPDWRSTLPLLDDNPDLTSLADRMRREQKQLENNLELAREIANMQRDVNEIMSRPEAQSEFRRMQQEMDRARQRIQREHDRVPSGHVPDRGPRHSAPARL